VVGTNLEDDCLFDLEEEIGTITSAAELCPDVFRVTANPGGYFSKEYLVVLDGAPISPRVRNYGKKINGLHLYAMDDDSSGWRVVQYEVSKYCISVRGEHLPEWMFRDLSLHAMELHPEYFGAFPVPFHTPHGYTLRHRTLANGIYWLETSMCKELLAVCHPIWNAELSSAARMLCETPVRLISSIQENATDYIFFTKEVSCIPIYELMAVRKEWDGTLIRSPALMNAIWDCLPEYALYMNGETDSVFKEEVLALMPEPGVKPLPDPSRDRMICMFPDEGTEFLMWD